MDMTTKYSDMYDEFRYCESIIKKDGEPGKIYEFENGIKIKLNDNYKLCSPIIGNYIKISEETSNGVKYGFIILKDYKIDKSNNSSKEKEYDNNAHIIKIDGITYSDEFDDEFDEKTLEQENNLKKKIDDKNEKKENKKRQLANEDQLIRFLNHCDYFSSNINKDELEKQKRLIIDLNKEICKEMNTNGYMIIEPKYNDVMINENNYVIAQTNEQFQVFNDAEFSNNELYCFISTITKKEKINMPYFITKNENIIMIPNGSTYMLYDTNSIDGGIIDEDIVKFMYHSKNFNIYKKVDNSLAVFDDDGSYITDYEIVKSLNNNEFIIKDCTNNSFNLLDLKKDHIGSMENNENFFATDFFTSGTYIFDNEFNIVEKYDKIEEKKLFSKNLSNSFIDKNGNKVSNEKKMNSFLKKRIKEMSKNPEKYSIKDSNPIDILNKEIYNLEDQILYYLNQINNEQLNAKFNKMKENYDKIISELNEKEIQKRIQLLELKEKNDKEKINELANKNYGEEIKKEYKKYKNELSALLNRFMNDSEAIEVLATIKELRNLIKEPIKDINDPLLLDANKLVNEIYPNLEENLKKRNLIKYESKLSEYENIINKHVSRVEEKEEDKNFKYISYEAWEKDFTTDLLKLAVEAKEDHKLQTINQKIKICRSVTESIEKNNNEPLINSYNKIENIIEEIKSKTTNVKILEKLKKYDDIEIDTNKSMKENIEILNKYYQELMKINVDADYILGYKEYDDYDSQRKK